MSLPIFERLSKLGAYNKRRVRPDQEVPEIPDISTGPIDNLAPPENVFPPIENTSNIDVRANQIISPQPQEMPETLPQPQEETALSKIGRFLGDLWESSKTTPERNRELMATAQEYAEKAAPPRPTRLPIPEKPNPLGAISTALKQWYDVSGEGRKANEEVVQKAQQAAGYTPAPSETPQEHIEEGPIYGSTDEFAKRPELQQKFSNYTGIDFTPEIQEQTKKYEAILTGMDEELNKIRGQYDEQMARAKERIENNQATDMDKFYIGLALTMPLIIGGVFGAEAGLQALGGGAKGLADLYGSRQKRIGEEEEAMADISKKQAEIALKQGELNIERAKIPETIKKSLPKDEFEHLKNMEIASWINPETGNEEGGVQILPQLVAKPQYLNSDKALEAMRGKAEKLNEEKASLDIANNATEKVIEIASKIEDPSFFMRQLGAYLQEEKTGGQKEYGGIMKRFFTGALAPEIMYQGRKVNAANILDSLLEQIKDAYRRNEGMKAYTQTVAAHISNMADNPMRSGLKMRDLIDQMLLLRDRAQNFYIQKASNQGFYADPIISEFGKLNRNIYKNLNLSSEEEYTNKIANKLGERNA